MTNRLPRLSLQPQVTLATPITNSSGTWATADIEPWVRARRETSEKEYIAFMRSQLAAKDQTALTSETPGGF